MHFTGTKHSVVVKVQHLFSSHGKKNWLFFFFAIDIHIAHTGQCKRTGGCYNELVVAYFSTGGGVKGKKSIPVDFIIYL